MGLKHGADSVARYKPPIETLSVLGGNSSFGWPSWPDRGGSYDVCMPHDSSLAVGEESVAVLHPHWKTLVGPVAMTFVVVAVLLAGEVLIPAGKSAPIERLALAVVTIALL